MGAFQRVPIAPNLSVQSRQWLRLKSVNPHHQIGPIRVMRGSLPPAGPKTGPREPKKPQNLAKLLINLL